MANILVFAETRGGELRNEMGLIKWRNVLLANESDDAGAGPGDSIIRWGAIARPMNANENREVLRVIVIM